MTQRPIIRGRFGESYLFVDPFDIVRARNEDHARSIVDRVGGRDHRSDDETERLIDGLLRGELIAVRVRSPVQPLDPAKEKPLVDPGDIDEPLVDPDRARWIEIEVVHEDGGGLDVLLRIQMPDGDVRLASFDGRNRWRADDLYGDGDCTIALVADIPQQRPAGRATELKNDDVWLGPTAGSTVLLRPERTHRVVIVGGSTEVELLDDAGKAVPDERCVVHVGERQIVGLTNKAGLFVAHHPGSRTNVGRVEFPNVDASSCSHYE